MSFLDYLILGVVATVVFLAVNVLRKQGSCNGNCSHCRKNRK